MYVMQRLARAGVCSRRQAQQLMRDGRVTVDNTQVLDPVTKIGDEQVLRVDGNIVAHISLPKIWLYHKPQGELVTRMDPKGRRTIFETLTTTHVLGTKEVVPPHVMPIGRLDYLSEGLQLLTNDGNLAKFLMHPKSEILRRYHVWTQGRLPPEAFNELKQGVVVEGMEYKSIVAQQYQPNVIQLILTEGKNREIRKVLGHYDVGVRTLRRVQYGPYLLDQLPLRAVSAAPLHEGLLEAFQQSCEP